MKPLKPAVFVACLAPAAWLGWRAATSDLGTNPVETLLHETGEWTLRLLFVTLTVTPARKLLHLPRLAGLRRMFGLWAFAYACAHLLTYLVFDLSLDLGGLVADVAKRPYITVGFAGFTMLVPLAVTSTKKWMKRLGHRWTTLHHLIYPAALAGVIHWYWMVKADTREPLIYAGVLAVLLGYRMVAFVRPRLRA